MDKQKAKLILDEVITFYLDMHEDNPEIEPTPDQLEEMEKYIKNNLQ